MPEPHRRRQPGKRPKSPARKLNTTDVVITPGGARPRSLAHVLEPGHRVSLKDGHVRIIETATGNEMHDLGPYSTHDDDEEQESEPPSPALTGAAEPLRGLSDVGWIESSQWRNGGTDPIVYFTTSWIVPPAPASDHGQLIYLFNGLTPDSATHILQPVLQWGTSPAGGGTYWSIANYYAADDGKQSVETSAIPVSPGTVLQGVMTCTAQSSSGYNYTCEFVGYPDGALRVDNMPEVLTVAYETLEAYGGTVIPGTNPPQPSPLTQCSDYPATAATAMYNIEIKTGTPGGTSSHPTITWTPVTSFTDCGQQCTIVSNDSPGGAVNLYFRSPPRPRTSSMTKAAAAKTRSRTS